MVDLYKNRVNSDYLLSEAMKEIMFLQFSPFLLNCNAVDLESRAGDCSVCAFAMQLTGHIISLNVYVSSNICIFFWFPTFTHTINGFYKI